MQKELSQTRREVLHVQTALLDPTRTRQEKVLVHFVKQGLLREKRVRSLANIVLKDRVRARLDSLLAPCVTQDSMQTALE